MYALLPATALAAIPSPPANGVNLGPVRLHVYGLMIALGIVGAVWLAQRRWHLVGGAPGTMAGLAIWGVPGGLIGARIYSLATSWQVDTGGSVIQAFEIWHGGLGIWGGVLGGVALGLVGARRRRLPLAPLLDAVAPAIPLGQAIGRWGNFFNQELYGRPSNLPWAVRIDHPVGYPPGTTFQPTFLYESIWDLGTVLAVIWIGRRFRIRRGYLFAVYAALYTPGRFWIEYLRIDTAHRFFGLRLNDWSSILVFAVAVALLVLRGRPKPGDELVGDPLRSPGDTPAGEEAPAPDAAGGGGPPAGERTVHTVSSHAGEERAPTRNGELDLEQHD
ncbi:MAG: prolipoprotein diacylglyceryl transferase [Acidimicrobiaceae bacterium]|nr:prolipoprotein diacylglyceryl transferase [Acidimicrobiaceae bacterium]